MTNGFASPTQRHQSCTPLEYGKFLRIRLSCYWHNDASTATCYCCFRCISRLCMGLVEYITLPLHHGYGDMVRWHLLSPLTLHILNVQYAVQEELAIKPQEYREKAKTHPKHHGLPLSKVATANIGNPQQAGLDQKPLTFGRQVDR